ncbi:MAG: hypothetical protein H6Q13_3179 [Bacteroidetes bacterium]|nr:hypothetical protein [Bacteroidota bacterium]
MRKISYMYKTLKRGKLRNEENVPHSNTIHHRTIEDRGCLYPYLVNHDVGFLPQANCRAMNYWK